MNKLIVIISVLFMSKVVLAEGSSCTIRKDVQVSEEKKDINTVVPNNLKGATIIIKTADGKEQEVPAETFKVVPRKQQFVVVKTKEIQKIECDPIVKVVEKKPLKNRVSLLAGKGPKEGLDSTTYPTIVDVESKVGAVIGLQYQRLITNRVSLGAELLTSKTALIEVGLDF
jgi:hypothetical protein